MGRNVSVAQDMLAVDYDARGARREQPVAEQPRREPRAGVELRCAQRLAVPPLMLDANRPAVRVDPRVLVEQPGPVACLDDAVGVGRVFRAHVLVHLAALTDAEMRGGRPALEVV